MKLRQLVEDFIVEEVPSVYVRPDRGQYKVYMMEKRGLETFSLISYLAKANNIPFKEFGYAGLKDRHATTRQLISVPAEYDIRTLHEKSFDLERKGYSDAPIRPGQLCGNRFMIIVRDLSEVEVQNAVGIAGPLVKNGIPNYFDSQRFGSVPHGEFIAKHLIAGDHEKAMKVHLTHYDKKENRQVKADKRSILEKWDDLSRADIKSKHLRIPVDTYLSTGSWERAYHSIAQNMRELFLSAYQSHIWNECVKELLISSLGGGHLEEVRYSLGSLLFFKDIDIKDLSGLPPDLPVIGRGIEMDTAEEELVARVLEREGVELGSLRDLVIAGDQMRSYRRNVLMRPDDLTIGDRSTDELNSRPGGERYKLTVSFQTLKGSYGTVVIKGLFGR